MEIESTRLHIKVVKSFVLGTKSFKDNKDKVPLSHRVTSDHRIVGEGLHSLHIVPDKT